MAHFNADKKNDSQSELTTPVPLSTLVKFSYTKEQLIALKDSEYAQIPPVIPAGCRLKVG